ncbi:ABC transporter permease [Streptomyces krungchingensis]|uniref:ABC transporter permease n=1 Tax=Streptomyces krungchingensis TaxID=1565034 RepID=UPI003CF23354
MKNPLVRLLSLRRAVMVIVALPLVVSLAVMAYAWPASRIEPRDLPVGIVGTSAASQNVVEGLARSKPGAFDFHLYADEASARSAIKSREVYGAFVITPGSLTVLEASAASTSVAQLIHTSGQQLAAQAAKSAAKEAPAADETSVRSKAGRSKVGRSKADRTAAESSAKIVVTEVDVVPSSADDPRGVVFNSAVLPLTICSILIASFLTMSGLRMPRWRRVLELVLACAAAGFTAYLVAQGMLGALPHEQVATWAAVSLTMLAVSATSAGLITLVGPAGLGLTAVLMVFVGNPFSGVTSAPEMLPKAVNTIGQWLPPGAGANLLRSTAYFDGNGSEGHITVLALWCVLGLTAVALGRRTRAVADGSPVQHPDGVDGAGTEAPVASDTTTPDSRPTPEGHSESPALMLEASPARSHARHAADH